MARLLRQDLVTQHVQSRGDARLDLSRRQPAVPVSGSSCQSPSFLSVPSIPAGQCCQRGGGGRRPQRPSRNQTGVEDLPHVDDVGGLTLRPRSCLFRLVGVEHCLHEQTNDLHVSGGGDDDRFRAEPFVEDTLRMHGGHGVSDLTHHPGGLQRGQRAGGKQLTQGAAGCVLTDDKTCRLWLTSAHCVQHPHESRVGGHGCLHRSGQNLGGTWRSGVHRRDDDGTVQLEVESSPQLGVGKVSKLHLEPKPVAQCGSSLQGLFSPLSPCRGIRLGAVSNSGRRCRDLLMTTVHGTSPRPRLLCVSGPS